MHVLLKFEAVLIMSGQILSHQIRTRGGVKFHSIRQQIDFNVDFFGLKIVKCEESVGHCSL